MTIQAPAVNFVQMTITATTPVVAEPTPFIDARLRHPGSLLRIQ